VQNEPKPLVLIIGQPPLTATAYELEHLRCNACGQVFTALESAEVGPDKYDDTTGAMIAQLKCGSGIRFYRLEKAASKIWGFLFTRQRNGRSGHLASMSPKAPFVMELNTRAAGLERGRRNRDS